VLSTDQKGSIAEASIAAAAIRLGIDVYKPLSDGTRCDLIFDIGGQLARIQCKWAARHGDTLIVRCYRNRRTRDGLLRQYYTAEEVDAFAAYSFDVDRAYFLPFDRFSRHRQIQLRLAPSRNNQRAGINWANDYEFGATLGAPGVVAQLGERSDGIRKVRGSIPLGSIS
jgi:PD-(D/E)XK endonuclease